MKQILLLAAIYSLIIHQSNKKTKEKIYQTAPKTKITEEIPAPYKFTRTPVILKDAGFKNVSFIIPAESNIIK